MSVDEVLKRLDTGQRQTETVRNLIAHCVSAGLTPAQVAECINEMSDKQLAELTYGMGGLGNPDLGRDIATSISKK